MPDRKYTYQVEIDATQAKQQASQLRQLFEKELAQIGAAMGRGGGVSGIGQEAQQAAAPVAEIAAELQKIAKIDLTKPIDDLQLEITQTAQQLDRLRAEYDRLSTTGGMGGKTGAQAASYKAYIDEIRRMVSDEAASAMQSTGQYLNVGQRNTQFVAEHEEDYLAFARDYHSKNRDVQDKAKLSTQERADLAQLESEMYDAQSQITQAERVIAERRLQQYAEALNTAPDDEIAGILEAGQRAQEEITQLTEQEEYLLRTIATTNDQIASLAKQAQQEIAEAEQKAARKRGELSAATAPSAGTTYTQQTALTVSKGAVDNARQLADQMRETADLTERIAENTKKITQADIGRVKSQKEAYVAQEQARRLTEESLRTAEKEKAVAIEKARAEKLAQQAVVETAKAQNQAAQQGKIAQQGITAATKAESAERQQLARAEATVTIEAARTAGVAAREEQRRATANLKAEIAERNVAQRTAAATQRAGAGTGTVFGMTPGMIGTGIASAIGIYSADQIARQAYSTAREGAMLARTAQTFEQIAGRVNVSSRAMVQAIRAASKETITDMDAMGIGAQILSQKWASSADDIVGDTASLVEASRRLAQVYTDEQGNFLTTQEVFSRLIKFVREGNKELVDQFGLSNQRIAESLGITVQGLASASGATDRFRGLVKVLAEDMGRLGPAMETTADQFERSEARITAARQRIGVALAEPIANLAEGTAGVLEGLQIRSGAEDPNLIESFLRQRQESFASQNIPVPEDISSLIDLFSQLDDATNLAADASKYFSNEMSSLAQDILNQNGATAAQTQRIAELGREIELAASGQDSYSRVMQIVTREALEQDSRFLALARTMGQYQTMYEQGEISLTTYNQLSGQLAATLFELARAAGTLAPALASVNAQLATANQAAGLLGGPIMGQGALQSPAWFTMRQDQDAFRQDRIDAQTQRDATARAEAKREQERIASETERAWKSAADKAAAEWERAAQATADEFKGALESVPGLFGTTSVTAEDMTLSKYGLYEPKADEYLRQLRDEVINKVDYENVDIRDAASRMGIDPNLPAEAILAMFEQAWANSSLFSGGANLDLINKDAILNELGRQEASKSGKESILAYFGLSDEDLQITDPGARDAFTRMMGLDGESITAAGAEARAQFVTGFTTGDGATATADAKQQDFLAPILKGMEDGLTAGDAADRIYGIGGAIVGRLYAGFNAAASDLAWGAPIIDALAASVAPQVYDMLAAELNP